MNTNKDNIAAASRFISKNFLATAKNTDSDKDKKAGKEGSGHPLMPADKDTRHAVHHALKAVHHAVFGNKDNDTVDKTKKAHKLLVDAAKPDEDNDDDKGK